jgi:bifunctional DNA-binding transcriptional regulator/antitoxin component of YhaV-PrlF toxin-antitoxin module
LGAWAVHYNQSFTISMTVTVKNKTPLVVPPVVCRQAGFEGSDELEFKVSGGVIMILPKIPAADGEYTPAQRRAIDRGIAKGLEDIRQGRTHGPFATADEAIAYLKAYTRQRHKKAAPRKTSR